ncbi:MAG: DUF4244 domain-containing protein [Actinobacteria bacterium]|nr:DUF4244 domain-containing protein [Actinomycetota bacterium]MCB9389775.1 DUF4244 domain-containing protein [Acidimicrobiia bacterium]
MRVLSQSATDVAMPVADDGGGVGGVDQSPSQGLSDDAVDPRSALRFGDESGQSTAEYALVMLGAAAVATLLITWATGSGSIGRLFDAVIDSIINSVT